MISLKAFFETRHMSVVVPIREVAQSQQELLLYVPAADSYWCVCFNKFAGCTKHILACGEASDQSITYRTLPDCKHASWDKKPHD